MSDYRFCTVEDEGRVRVVTLNRPEVMNALHSEAHWELDRVWNEFAADPALWVAIITGAGERAFSAGNDLKAQAAGKRGIIGGRPGAASRRPASGDPRAASRRPASGNNVGEQPAFQDRDLVLQQELAFF